MKKIDRKLLYFLFGCIVFSIVVIGATYAYFTARANDLDTIKGNSATVTFGLSVERVTTVDMAFGLVPMKNSEAPNAAKGRCYDVMGNAGCQLYRIRVNADSDTVMFLDGYIELLGKEGVETRFSRVYTDDEEANFYTEYHTSDFSSNTFDESKYIKTGVRMNSEGTGLNRTEDYNCLLFSNEKVGGDVGRERLFYVMVWVYDNGHAQDYLQGMELAYRGEVTFVTAEGNEISATFD